LYTLLRHPSPQTLKLSVKTPAKTVLDYEVRTRSYRADSLEMAESLPAQLGYLRVNGLYSGAAENLLAPLTKWDKEIHNGAILDLRDAGGTDIQSVADVAGVFSEPDALLFTYRDHSGSKLREFHAPPADAPIDLPSIRVPMMVLVNQQTHGAAELLAAVLAASGRGVMVVGETTRGNPGVREMIDLPSGEKIWLAVKTVTLADGSVYSGDRGLSPDVLVNDVNLSEGETDPLDQAKDSASNDPAYLASEKLKQRVKYDALLQRAVDILLGLKALNIRLLAS
jgi:C-terminal processing protease CtpA/Prc